MTEGLKEKTKTFYELGKEWMETKLVDDRNNEKWILVSVAQRDKENELAKQQEAFQKQVGYLKEDIKKLERERGLLKQKLREFWKWLEQKAWRGVSSEVIDEFGERFEELLK